MLDSSGLRNVSTSYFTGRAWAFERLEAWLSKPGQLSFLVGGGPGSGKTAFAARLVEISREKTGEAFQKQVQKSLAYAHFCRNGDESSLNPLDFVRMLSLTLSRRYPRFAETLAAGDNPGVQIEVNQRIGRAAKGSSVQGVVINNLTISRLSTRIAFDQLVRKPLEALCGPDFKETILIVVDSLDEAQSFDPEENIAALLAHVSRTERPLPEVVRFLLTGRFNDPRLLSLFRKPDLNLNEDAPPDQDDIRTYARLRLGERAGNRKEALADKVASASQGNFLYARYVLEELLVQAELPADLEALEFPDGLEAVYRSFIRRELAANDEKWEQRYSPLLGLLAVARSPGLSSEQIMDISGLDESKARSTIKACAQYLSGRPPEGPFTIYHQSFRDFLTTDPDFSVFPAEAHRRLGEFFNKVYSGNWAGCLDGYALRHTPYHLAQAAAALNRPAQRSQRAGLVEALTELILDLDYLEAWVRSASIYAVLFDLGEAARLLPETERREHPIQALLNALDLETHNLVTWQPEKQPALLVQQLYNRTRENPRLSALAEACAQRLAQSGMAYFEKTWSTRREPAVLVRTLEGHEGAVNALAMTSDERYLVSGGEDGWLAVWELKTGRLLHRLDELIAMEHDRQIRDSTYQRGSPRKIAEGAVAALAVLPGDRYVRAGLRTGEILVLDLGSGKSVPALTKGIRSRLITFSQSPDARYLAVMTWGNAILLENTPHAIALLMHDDTSLLDNLPAAVQELPLPVDRRTPVTAFAALSDRILLAVLDERIVQILSFEPQRFMQSLIDGKPLPPLILGEQEAIITSIAVTPDGALAVTAGTDGVLKVWDLLLGQEVGSLGEPEAPSFWDPWHGTAASRSRWEETLQRRIYFQSSGLRGAPAPLPWYSTAITPDGRLALSGLSDGRLRLWELKTRQLSGEVEAHRGDVRALLVSPSGRYAASGGEDGKIKVWDLGAPFEHTVDHGHRDWVNGLIWTPDGSRIISGSDDGTIRLWDAETGKELAKIAAHEGWVLDFAFSQDGQTLYSAGGDGKIKAWEASTLAHLRTYAGHEGRAHGVRVTQAGELVSAGADQTVKVWEAESGEARLTLVGHAGKVIRTAPVPNRRLVISASEDATLRLWNLDSGEEVSCLRGHEAQVDAVTVTPDGSRVVSASYDGTVRTWDLASGECLHVLHGHRAAVYKLALSADGRHIFSVSADRTVRAWELESGQESGLIPLEQEASSIAVDAVSGAIAAADGSGNIYRLAFRYLMAGQG